MSKTPNTLAAYLGVTLTEADRNRFQPHLVSWMKLHELLLLQPPLEDLKKLVLMEAQGKGRPFLLEKLTARLKTVESAELRAIATKEASK